MAGPLADLLFWLAVLATGAANALILRSTMRGMRVVGARVSPAWEWLWALLPIAALAVLLVFTWRAMHPATFQMTLPADHAPPGALPR